MYALYYAPATASMAPHILLRELQVEFELRRVDTEKGEQHDPAYRAINPNARIPALQHDELILWEAAAICTYLCDRHAEAGFAPAPGSKLRGEFYKWLTWLTNTIQPDMICWFYPERFVPAADVERFKLTTLERLMPRFALLDEHLGDREWIVGEQITAVDLYAFMLSRWTRNMPRRARDLPNLRRLLDRVMARPATRTTYEVEGIREPYF
jgi:glutathione S-transferase